MLKSDREAIEESLVANPDDRTAFAVYADLLQEQGKDAKAELIRVQLDLEDDSLSDLRRTELQLRELELFEDHHREWLGELAPIFLDQEIPEYMREYPRFLNQVIWRRGCLMGLHFAGLDVNIARILRGSADRLPLLRELSIGGTTYEEAGHEYTPGPDIPTDLETRYPSVAILRQFSRLNQLRAFCLGQDADLGPSQGCDANGELVQHLVMKMPHLEELGLFAQGVDVQTLFSLPMPNLRVFKVYHCDTYPLDRLAENTTLTNLTTLSCHPHAYHYGENAYDPEQVRALVRSKYLTNLTTLRLRLFYPGDDGIREIVESGILERLRVLDLSCGPITDAGAEILASSPHTQNLTQLDLSNNALTDVGISRLLDAGVNLVADTQHADDDEWMYYGDIE